MLLSTDQGCSQWNQLAKDAKQQGFGAIRIEGFDCDALDRASSAAASVGIKVLAGIYASVRTIKQSTDTVFVFLNLSVQGHYRKQSRVDKVRRLSRCTYYYVLTSLFLKQRRSDLPSGLQKIWG